MSPVTRAIFELIRFDKPAGTLLLLLPCYWGAFASADAISFTTLFWFAIGAFAMRSAGCVVNDMADRNIDAQVVRTQTRPLASGALTMRHAAIVLVILLILAAFSAAMLGLDVMLLGLAWLPLVAAYPFMKRITFFPQAFLGITFGAGALFGSMAVAGSITMQAWWLYGAGFFWVLGYDTIYACQDREDDARIGVKSTALFFGAKVQIAVAICYALAFLCIVQAVLQYEIASQQLAMLLCIAASFALQIMLLPKGNYMSLFKSNVISGIFIWVLMSMH